LNTEEVLKIADRITVLKDGELMGTVRPQDTDEGQLIKMMVGRVLGEFFPDRHARAGKEILAVKDLGMEDMAFSSSVLWNTCHVSILPEKSIHTQCSAGAANAKAVWRSAAQHFPRWQAR
jgi:ABC-type uncharacterized transport system ATPase subunit